MPDRYWVGTDSDWHTAANWSATSGGAGGAGVPTASDDVYVDGNGYVLCWATTAFVCSNFTILSGSTELCLFDQGGVINGDFEMQDGYFGPTGGGGYTVEFKGDYLNTGGTFAVGTGTGVDPTCEFSGTGKTYVHNNSSSASYQNFTVSGSYMFSGTRLAVANISQDMDISGTVTFSGTNAFVLTGEWVGMDGTITSTGGSPYVQYEADSTKSMPTGGTIEIRVELCVQDDFTLPARTWGGAFYLIYEADQKAVTMGAGKHYFGSTFTLYADDAAITTSAELDCGTNDAEFRCYGKWSVYRDSFKQPSVFVLSWDDGTHIFYDEFQMGVFGDTTDISMNAGDSTIVLRPIKNQLYNYRLSRVRGGWPAHYDELTWNKIYLLRTSSDTVTSIRFIEGFVCSEGRFELYNPANVSVRFRNRNLLPQHDTTFDRLTLLGIDGTLPLIGYPVITGFGWYARIIVNEVEETNIFNVTIAKMKVFGSTVDTYNSELWVSDSGLSAGFNFYDRDVRTVCGQRNLASDRNRITPTPAEELLIERIVEVAA